MLQKLYLEGYASTVHYSRGLTVMGGSASYFGSYVLFIHSSGMQPLNIIVQIRA